MELTNVFYEYLNNNSAIGNWKLEIGNLLKMLSPFAPHISEELWHQLGHKNSICQEKWPEYDPELVKETEITIAIQVNGKLRETIAVAADLAEEEVKAQALAAEKIKTFIAGKQIVKTIVIPKKLINIVIK